MIILNVNSPDKNIFTNEKKTVDQDFSIVVEEVIIDTDNGNIGIRDGHENIISSLNNGEMKIIYNIFSGDKNEKKDNIFAISPGVLKVETKNNITNISVLLQEAEDILDSNIEELEKAINRARELINEKDDDIFLSERLLRDMNKVRIAKKYR